MLSGKSPFSSGIVTTCDSLWSLQSSALQMLTVQLVSVAVSSIEAGFNLNSTTSSEDYTGKIILYKVSIVRTVF